MEAATDNCWSLGSRERSGVQRRCLNSTRGGGGALHACSPAAIPIDDPIAACRHMSGEESRMAHRKMSPVHRLSQPYICPTPTGRDFSNCENNLGNKVIKITGQNPIGHPQAHTK